MFPTAANHEMYKLSCPYQTIQDPIHIYATGNEYI